MDEKIVSNIEEINSAFQMGQRAIGNINNDSTLDSDLSDRAEKCADFYTNQQIADLIKIEATDLRRLIINHSQNPVGKRLFLKGVFIKGRLDLEGLSGNNGSPLPELHLIQCMFEQGICFSGTSIQHLSLRGSRFLVNREAEDSDFGDALHHICGENAKIKGNLDLSHLRPLKGFISKSRSQVSSKVSIEDAIYQQDCDSNLDKDLFPIFCDCVKTGENTLTANLKNTYVCGSLLCTHSIFVEDYIVAASKKPKYSARYAFNISGVTIEKHLYLDKGFTVEGGVKAIALHCKNEAWLAGSNLSNKYRVSNSKDLNTYKAPPVHALNFQSAQFDKVLCISLDRDRSKITGDVNFYSAKAANVHIESLKLINGSFTLPFFQCKQFYLSSYKPMFVGGCSNKDSDYFSKFDTRDARIDYLYLSLDKFESLNLEGIVSHKIEIHGKSRYINLNSATINKDCVLACESFKIYFNRAGVGGELNIRKWVPVEYKIVDFKNIDLNNWPSLSLKQTNIKGSINVGKIKPRHHVKTLRYSLNCYKNYELVVSESRREVSNDRLKNVFIAYLEKISEKSNNSRLDESEFYRLEGTSNIFHKLNNMKELSYRDKASAIEYLILFCAYTWGDEGPFRIVTYKQLRNNMGKIIDDKNRERPQIPCKKSDGKIIKKQVIGKLKAYEKLSGNEGLLNDFRNFKLYLKDSTEASLSDEIEKLDINEGKFHYFIPATIIYDSEIFLGLFALLYSEKDKVERDYKSEMKLNDSENSNTHVQLLAEFCICSISTDSVNKDDSDVPQSIIGDHDLGSSHDFGWADVLNFDEFIKRSGGKGALVKVGHEDSDKELNVQDFLPEITFDDESKTTIFTPNENSEKPEVVLWKAWGATRMAFVNLSDTSCELLDDGSGRGWGDKIILQTDRFRFRNLVRKDVEEIDNSKGVEKNEQKASIKKIMEEFYIPPIYLPTRAHEEGAITYQNPPDLTFFEQRLLWLCHYHREGIHLNKSPDSPDSGTFRRIARIYRSNGLTEAANYIDEARIRFDHNTHLSKIKSADWSIEANTCRMLLYLFFACFSISILVGFYFWAILAAIAALIVIVWNQTIQERVKNSLIIRVTRLIDFAFRSGFRYGLSLVRPVITIILFIGVGWWGIQYLDKEGFMILETTVVAQSVKEVKNKDKDKDKDKALENLEPHIYKVSNSTVPATRVGCGNTIDYAIYAVDIFIPLIELDQEERCMIRPFDSSGGDIRYIEIFSEIYSEIFDSIRSESIWSVIQSIRFWFVIKSIWSVIIDHPTTWRVLQTIYILLGWVIISASLLTFSGYLQRQAESSESEQKNR